MSDFMYGAMVVIAIIAFSAAGAATILKYQDGFKECKYNSDCHQDNFCGSDFRCHAYPVVERTVYNNDYTTPAGILGLAIVVGAMMLRKGRNQHI